MNMIEKIFGEIRCLSMATRVKYQRDVERLRTYTGAESDEGFLEILGGADIVNVLLGFITHMENEKLRVSSISNVMGSIKFFVAVLKERNFIAFIAIIYN